MADFTPVRKVSIDGQEFAPIKKATTKLPQDMPEKPVPEWGRKDPTLYGMYGVGRTLFDEILKPTVKGLGLALGGMGGSAAGPAGTIGGAALGYGIAKKGTEIAERGLDWIEGAQEKAKTIPQELISSGKDIAEGAVMEVGGQTLGATIPIVAKAGGKLGAQAIGKLTGTGTEAARQAYKSGVSAGLTKNPLAARTAFDKAMRGKLTGEDVVGIARDALSKIKDARAAEYQASLQRIMASRNLPAIPGQTGIGLQKIDVKPIGDKLKNLMAQYNIKTQLTPDGKVMIDTSRVAMGKKGIRDLKEVIKLVGEWGRKDEDFTILGLDTLKRQLDDFYSDSSQARQFVTSLRSSVSDTAVKAVPEYGKMTKRYAEATKLIKDIESNLMMRKQAMSGRIVSDQTLRRLMSAMKDNFELRKELVGALMDQGGQDVMGAVAGYSMKTLTPRGLAGTGPALIGNLLAAKFLNPAFIPVVAMSSPRVAGEFLRMFGKYAAEFQGVAQPMGRALAFEGTEALLNPAQVESLGQPVGNLVIPSGQLKLQPSVR